MHTELLVLGGGPGGYAAAFLAADLGMAVTLVDRNDRLGGTCLREGCIPSKALLRVARVIAECDEVTDWGVCFERMRIDVAALRARKEKVIASLAGGLAQLARRRQVKVVRAVGAFVDSQTVRLKDHDGTVCPDDEISFDRCILASGSRSIVPETLAMANDDRVMDSRGALALADVPPKLLVVGGGYIGLELGTAYAALGAAVTLVEMTDHLLPGVDRDLVKPLHKRLQNRFAGLFLSTRVAELAAAGPQVTVTLDGLDTPAPAAFDRVLLAVGRQPTSVGVGLENTRVETDQDGFVIVDPRQQTSDPHILAVGDVAGPPLLAHKATRQGKVAAEVVCGGPAAFDPRAIPAVVFTDPEIAWTGLTREQAQSAGLDVRVAQYPWQASGRAVAIGRSEGLTKWIIDASTEQILGAGIVGAGAGELIAEATLAIEMGCTVRDVAETIHPHPTLSETAAFAAEVDLGIATEVYRPRRKRRSNSSTA